MLTTIIFPTVHAQLVGHITDAQGNGLPFANVLLTVPSDSSLVKGTVTDVDGRFYIGVVPTGVFLLSARSIGYQSSQPTLIQIFADKQTDAGTIVLEEAATELHEVIVRAEKPLFEQQLDKLVVNVENSIVSSGGTVLDVLERSPGISVNRQSGSMNMNGKQGVMVMINGKLQRLPLSMVVQQLEGLSANSVDKIEIIANPSSRFDAEGDAGIINIITKKNLDAGTNGSATIGVGYGTYTGYWKPNTSININHKRNQVIYYANYSMNHDRRWQQWNYERQVFNPDQYSLTISDRYVRWPIQRANLGMEWNITKRTAVNILTSGFSNLWKMEAYNTTYAAQNGADSANILLHDREVNHWKHIMGSINVSHALKDNSRINIDLDYLYYHDHNPNLFNNHYHFIQTGNTLNEEVRISKTTPINMVVAKVDFEKKFDKMKLEAGIKSTFSRLNNDVSLEILEGENWIPDTKFTQQYELRDDVNAAYANVSGNVGGKGKFQLGLRAEQTDMEMNTGEEKLFKLNFWSIFPTVFYSKQINATSSYQLSYGRRITRPGYTDVAPFVIFMDPFTYYWGNPRLRPALSDGLQASYTINDLLLSLRYTYDKNSIARNQSRFEDVDRKTYIYSDNVDVLQLLALTASAPVSVNTWWKMQNNALLTYQRIDHNLNGTLLLLEQFSTRISTNQIFTLPGNFSLEVSGIYVAPRRIGLSILKHQADVSVGIQKKFKNGDKLSVNVNDILWTTKAYYRVDNPLLRQIQQTSYINEPRIIRVAYTLNFGNRTMRNIKLRSTASEAEQQRVN